MAQLYGQAWAREFGQTPSPAWRAMLRDLSAEDVRAGLRYAATEGRRLPPTGPEFRAWCRPPKPRQSAEQRALYGRMERRADLPALPDLMARSSVGRQWRAFCWLDGILPRPPKVTLETLDAMLEGADVADMRRRHAGQLASLRRRMGVAA